MTPTGFVSRRSRFPPDETADRLAASVSGHGMTLMARIDHAAAAAKAGMTLRPTQVLIFGAARAGTPLMQSAQTMGVDLPLRALVWQDEAGQTWLGYNDPHWLAERHGASAAASVEAMTGALAAVVAEACGEAARSDD